MAWPSPSRSWWKHLLIGCPSIVCGADRPTVARGAPIRRLVRRPFLQRTTGPDEPRHPGAPRRLERRPTGRSRSSLRWTSIGSRVDGPIAVSGVAGVAPSRPTPVHQPSREHWPPRPLRPLRPLLPSLARSTHVLPASGPRRRELRLVQETWMKVIRESEVRRDECIDEPADDLSHPTRPASKRTGTPLLASQPARGAPDPVPYGDRRAACLITRPLAYDPGPATGQQRPTASLIPGTPTSRIPVAPNIPGRGPQSG
jgi:hypothetical protein